MKSLKKIKSKKIFAIVVLGLILSLNVADLAAGDYHGHNQHKQRKVRGGNTNTVGAPLDGGIITILLGGAGVAYFSRKRKKKNEQ